MIEAFKKSDVEILLSTMNRDTLDFLLPMFPFGHFSDYSILIINQTTEGKTVTSAYPQIRVLNVFEKGLSKSRNLAIENAQGKIGILTDDDVVFTAGFDEKVTTGFNRFTNAAIIEFSAATFDGKLFRKYPKEPTEILNTLQLLGTMSIEIGLNIQKVKQSGIRFDTQFGLGSFFPLGEESVFVTDLYKAGYGISFEPEIIVTHKAHMDSSNMPMAENYRIRGAYLFRIFKKGFFLWLGIQLMYHVKQGIVKPHQILHYIKIAVKGKKESIRLASK